MKTLCLHGAYGSAANFKVQLASVVEAIQKPGSVDFKWIDGGHTATPPSGFEDYFGPPPMYRFTNFDGIAGLDDILIKVRYVPEGLSAEDTMRRLVGDYDTCNGMAVKSTVDRLIGVLDQDHEIEGILGYSEGATVAATLILEERRRFEEEGRPRRLKYAVFFAGWPPLALKDNKVQILLADECEDMIDIPTCHVVGYKDPYIGGAMALYSMCDEDMAILFDHGKGHTIPRDGMTIKELSSAIERTFARRGVAA